MIIQRPTYLNQLIERRHNGMIKILTGIRRCGKSFLLFNIFDNWLKSQGIREDHLIKIDLENRRNKELRNPDNLLHYIDSCLSDKEQYYVMIDEIQNVPEFEDVLNSYLKISNVDLYVTGSNSKFLSSDIITEFRGRGDQISVYPLSFRECMAAFHSTPQECWKRFFTYGGLPQVWKMDSPAEKADFLEYLYKAVYVRDIINRYNLVKDEEFEELLRIMASNIGCPNNPQKLANTFESEKKIRFSRNTVSAYLDYMEDAFLINKVLRYDIKGKKYINTLSKYYFTDLGLRNAILNFRQLEENHIMENAIYNELRVLGFRVDVGGVTQRVTEDGTRKSNMLEVDFVANRGYQRFYIQSALSMPDREKREQESASLRKIDDSFTKIIVVKDTPASYIDDNGIHIIGLFDFLTKWNPPYEA